MTPSSSPEPGAVTVTPAPQRTDGSLGPTTIRMAESAADKETVLRLRTIVYVQDQDRLVDSRDMAATFDRFDAQARYLLAEVADEPVGTIKVVPDSAIGLPCEDVVDLAGFRAGNGNRLVELGHLMTVPEVRNREIGMVLMRAALVYAVLEHGATHIFGDFFADDDGGLRSFYRTIGFDAVGAAYPDKRFKDAPLSVVGVLDVPAAARRLPGSSGRERRLLAYFFEDYPHYRGASEPSTPAGR